MSHGAIGTRVVRESLDSVAARASRIVVAEVLSVDVQDDDASLGIAIEAVPEQLLAGEPTNDDAALTCEYRENRVQKRGSAVLSPLVSGSGEEFHLRHGDRVILLIAAPADAASASVPPGHAPAPAATDSDQADADGEASAHAAADTAPCTVLRVEPLQNRIAVLRALRHAAEARDRQRR